MKDEDGLKEIGSAIAIISKLYSIIKTFFEKFKISPRIIGWIQHNPEGQYFFQEALKTLWGEYLNAQVKNAKRFRVIKSIPNSKDDLLYEVKKELAVAMEIDGSIPPEICSLKHDRTRFVRPVGDCTWPGKIIVRKIGDDIYINNRKLIFFSTEKDDHESSISEMVKKIEPDDAVPAIIRDCLFEYDELIPERYRTIISEKWNEGPTIIFTGDQFECDGKTGFYSLHGSYEKPWETNFFDENIPYWDYRYFIAKLGPPEENLPEL